MTRYKNNVLYQFYFIYHSSILYQEVEDQIKNKIVYQFNYIYHLKYWIVSFRERIQLLNRGQWNTNNSQSLCLPLHCPPLLHNVVQSVPSYPSNQWYLCHHDHAQTTFWWIQYVASLPPSVSMFSSLYHALWCLLRIVVRRVQRPFDLSMPHTKAVWNYPHLGCLETIPNNIERRIYYWQ